MGENAREKKKKKKRLNSILYFYNFILLLNVADTKRIYGADVGSMDGVLSVL